MIALVWLATAPPALAATSTTAPPLAGFSAQQSPNSLYVIFRDGSTVGGATITAWSWDFGDGTSSTSQNPIHDYSGIGTYTVTLTVTASDGQASTISQAITVVVPPSSEGLASLRRVRTTRGIALLELSCKGNSGQSCPLDLVVALTAAAKRQHLREASTRVLALGHMKLRLSSAQRRTIGVRLDRAGRALLATYHHLGVQLTLTESGRSVVTRILTFRSKA